MKNCKHSCLCNDAEKKLADTDLILNIFSLSNQLHFDKKKLYTERISRLFQPQQLLFPCSYFPIVSPLLFSGVSGPVGQLVTACSDPVIGTSRIKHAHTFSSNKNLFKVKVLLDGREMH